MQTKVNSVPNAAVPNRKTGRLAVSKVSRREDDTVKGQTILKVTSILMIICGVIGVLVSAIAVMAVIALKSSGMGILPLILSIGSIITLVASVIQIIAGVRGLGVCKTLTGADKCVFWGAIITALAIISTILGLIGSRNVSITSIVLNLLIPILYTYSASQIKN